MVRVDGLAFAETIPVIVWRADSNGHSDYFNAMWFAYSGLSEAESIGSGWTVAIHPDDRAQTGAAWAAAVARQAQFDVEMRLRAADGTYRWFLSRGSPSLRPDGSLAGWLGICTDIDAQKTAAEGLRLAKMRAELIAEADTIFERSFAAPLAFDELARLVTAEFATICFVDALDDDGTLVRRAAVHRDPAWQAKFDAAPPTAPPWKMTHLPVRVLETGIERVTEHVDAAWLGAADVDPEHSAWLMSIGVNSSIGVPVIARGHRFGVLTLVRTGNAPAFTRDDLATALELGRRAAANLEHARLYALARENERRAAKIAEAERRATQKLAYFAELGERLTALTTLDETLDAVVESLVPDFADWAVVELLDGSSTTVAAAHHRDRKDGLALHALGAAPRSRTVVPAGTQAIRSGRPIIVYGDHGGPGAGPARFRSAVAVPLVVDDEICGVLTLAMLDDAGAFSDADLPFVQEVARRISPALATVQMYERERRIAETFQAAVLPRRLPTITGLRFDALYEAGKAEALVGGDWFDAFRIPDGRIVITIGDVQGNGLAAATTMAEARQSIRGAAAINPDPAILLDAADRILTGESNDDRFATAWVGIVDPIDFSLRYTSAGHPPPLLRNADGTIRKLEGGGLPLGLAGTLSQRRETFNTVVDAGALLVLFTDGLIESDRDALRDEAILAAALADASPPAATARELRDAVLGDALAHDDVAILLVDFVACLTDCGDDRASRWSFDVMDAVDATKARRALAEALRAGNLNEDHVIVAEIIVAELLGNVVRYARGRVDVILDQTADVPVLHVVDRGQGFEHNSRLPIDAYSENGRGLFIVSELAREFTISRSPAGGSHARVVLETRGTATPQQRVPQLN